MVVQGIRREVVPSYVAHAVVRLPRQRSVPRCGPLAAGGSIIPGKIGRASPPAVRAPKDNGLGRPPGRDCAPPEQRIHDLAPGRFAGIRRYPLPRPRPVPSGPPGAPTPNAAPNATTAGIRARAACVSGNPPASHSPVAVGDDSIPDSPIPIAQRRAGALLERPTLPPSNGPRPRNVSGLPASLDSYCPPTLTWESAPAVSSPVPSCLQSTDTSPVPPTAP